MLQVAVCMLHVTVKWSKAAWQSSQQRVIVDGKKKRDGEKTIVVEGEEEEAAGEAVKKAHY